jgi:hypothetical protein
MEMAQLCPSCSSGLRRAECLRCGNVIMRGIVAELCPSCASLFREQCIKCGQPISAMGVTALLCGPCASDPAGKTCVKCQGYIDQAAAARA